MNCYSLGSLSNAFLKVKSEAFLKVNIREPRIPGFMPYKTFDSMLQIGRSNGITEDKSANKRTIMEGETTTSEDEGREDEGAERDRNDEESADEGQETRDASLVDGREDMGCIYGNFNNGRMITKKKMTGIYLRQEGPIVAGKIKNWQS